VIFVIYRLESSFDNFHPNADRAYWVVMRKNTHKGEEAVSRTFYPLGAAMRSTITGVEAVTSVHWQPGYQLNLGKEMFEERFAMFVDSSYTDVFNVTWLAGNPKTAFTHINSVVITDKFAEQYFGNQSPMGKTFVIDNTLEVIVRGIVAAPPFNTDHPYRILLPFAALEKYLPVGQFNSWETIGNGNTYFVLAKQAAVDNVQQQLEVLKRQYLMEEDAEKAKFHFIHIKDMHFRNGDYHGYNYEFPEPVMIMLSIIAGLITVISCSNFINLATAQAIRRSKEIGIRKTFGSSRRLLVMQFLSETFAVTLLSIVVGLVIAKIGLLELNAVTGTNNQAPLQFNFWQEPSIIVFLLILVAGVALLSGLYPSIILARFKPVNALKNQVSTGKSRGWNFRKGLILLQFFGSQLLILVTIIILNQIDYLSQKPAGFDTESILLLDLPDGDTGRSALLRNRLATLPGIAQVSFSSAFPFGGSETVSLSVTDSVPAQPVSGFDVDENYLSTFGLKVIAGQDFYAATPIGEIIVNQTFLKKIGVANPQQAIGRTLKINEEPVMIRGVVQDYSTNAFLKTVSPVVLMYNTKPVRQVSIKLDSSVKAADLQAIKSAWQVVYPEYIFKHTWVEDFLSPKYGLFNIIYDMLRIFSCIAILIACLGLYNFASYMIMLRRKEISVRKILGSSETGIFIFLLKSLLSPVLVGFLIACPLAYMLGSSALQEFPDRVEPGILIFIKVFSAIMVLAVFAVGYRTYQAAKINLAKVLKYD
jgi:ABC-type antimicrobial peptide transport system permease subunit